MLRRSVLALLVLAFPSLAFAGPKEDAQAVFEKFLTSFTSAKVDDVVGLFAADALFYGTSSRELVTTPAGVRAYFTNAFGTPPRAAGTVKATSLGTSALVLSDNAVLVSGMWQTERVVDGKPTLGAPLRVSLVVAKRGDRWQVAQFHNSAMPAAPAAPPPAAQAAPPVR